MTECYITVSNLNPKSNGRFKTYTVTNHGQALGVVRMCLKTWGGFASIVAFINGKLVVEHFVYNSTTKEIIKTDRHAFKAIWNLAWPCFPDYEEPARPTMTYNVYNIHIEDPKKEGVFTRAVKWIKSKFGA